MSRKKKRGRLTKSANVIRRLWRVRLSNTARRKRRQKKPPKKRGALFAGPGECHSPGGYIIRQQHIQEVCCCEQV